MLTDKGLAAWNVFLKKTSAIVVTRTMSDEELEVFDMMLRDWQAEPTEKKEQEIISRMFNKN